MLNRPGPRDPPHIQPADRDLPIDTRAPTREEIRKAIKKLRNGKVTGPDSIPAEALTIDTETIEEMLHPLSKKIWEEENIPFEWKEGYIFENAKERRFEQLCKLQGDQTFIHSRKGFLQDRTGQDEGRG